MFFRNPSKEKVFLAFGTTVGLWIHLMLIMELNFILTSAPFLGTLCSFSEKPISVEKDFLMLLLP